MATFGYSPDRAERIRVQLDRDLKSVEHHLSRIAGAVPQAGAITGRLDDAKETVGEVVEDLHDVIGERTEVPA
jgi:hypothetical protein